jgi:PAS domain S-box-containing protein
MPEVLKVLFVEDLVNDYELALYEVKKTGFTINGLRVETQVEYKKALVGFKPDIIVSDYLMPQFNGMLALTMKKEVSPGIPFIMLTGSMNEETAVECMKAGADDYVIKEHIRRLPHAIETALANNAVKQEKRRTELELVKSDRLMRTAVNNLPSAFVIYDYQRRIEYINDFGLIFYGLQANDVIGKTDEEVFPAEITGSYLPALKKALEQKESQIIECQINYPDLHRFVIYHAVPILDENNELYKLLGIAFDITDRKNFEEKLNESRKKAEESDRIKSAFLANVSHELRTPLNAILGFSQLIKRNCNPDDPVVNYADVILTSGEQLLEVIKEMIEISQLESGGANITLSEFSLGELLDEIAGSFASKEKNKIENGIIFTMDCADELKQEEYLHSDRDKLNHILRNLIGNAFKFTQKGSIVFGCDRAGDGRLRFYVQDTGIGIAKEKISFIFDSFRQADETYTRKFGGIGLGLAICRSLVNLLGGKIWVESKEGEGSVFYFTLLQHLTV